MTDTEQVQVRCLVVGPPAVGKTTFIKKLTNGSVSQDYSMTSRVNVHRKSYTTANGLLQLEMSLLDCPGKEPYHSLVEDICKRASSSHNNGAKCVVVAVFDVTNRSSIAPVESLLTWLNKQNGKSVEQCGILVANKIDLVDKRIVSPAEGQQKAKMLKYRYLEASALNDIAVHEWLELLAECTKLAPTSETERNGPSQPAVAMKVLDAA